MGYDPTIGKWLEADSEEYVDGSNVYQMEESGPTFLVDPEGTQGTTTGPTTQPVNSIDLPGGPGDPKSGSTSTTVPGLGDISISIKNNNIFRTGGSADITAKISPSDSCKCTDLAWSVQEKITINNSSIFDPKTIQKIIDAETAEHGGPGNNPFDGFVLDNGLDGGGKPRPVAPHAKIADWPDKNNPLGIFDIGLRDSPRLPPDVYPPGVDVTKEYILTPYCDGKPLNTSIHYTIRGTSGSGQTSTVHVDIRGPK